jgi:hypothetical protein
MTPEPDKKTPAEDEAAGVGVVQAADALAPAADPIQKEAPARIGMVKSLDDLPAVAAYLHRVGAKEVNFKAARVTETVDGYPKSIGRIMFDATGLVTVSGDAEAPAPLEQAAITAAFATVQFPTMVTLTSLGTLPPDVKEHDRNVFVCHDIEGRIVMIQQRFEVPGGKGFRAWTFFSDGEWRNMEPDTLPFFGLPGAKDASTLFLHEGAGAAARVKCILANEEQTDFPWREEMRHGHHVGWIGGVHAIDRSDWGALAKLGWKRVIIVADNDANGKGMKAAARIARLFACDVSILGFDQRFDDGFDCGNDWPSKLFNAEGCYTGPSMADCLRPAIQATRLLEPEPGRPGRPEAVITSAFAEMTAYTIAPPFFFFRSQPSRALSEDEFNARTAPFSHAAQRTASKLRGEITCQHERLQYDCVHRPGPLIVDGSKDWNVFEPTRVRPLKGDPEPWLDLLRNLFPVDAERQQVTKWLATLIAMPQVRMRYGLLLISETQGVGKNTLATALEPLVGKWNVSYPSEDAVVNSQFNDWQARKRLIFVGEIYSGSSRVAYDRLKSVIADDVARINEKNVKPYQLANWATVIACSNSMAALHLDGTDRRWLVPTLSETVLPREYWNALYAWLRGDGSGIILRWAQGYVKGGNHVQTGDRAPGTARKDTIVADSRSEGQALAHGLAEHLAGVPGKVILRMRDVRGYIAKQRGFVRHGEPDIGERRLEKATTIGTVMKSVPGITVWAGDLRPNFGPEKDAVIMNFQPEEGLGWPDIKHFLTSIERITSDEPF